MPSRRKRRSGLTYLELQVAFALFAVALSGVGPLVVMHSRQTQQLEDRLDSEATYYLTPRRDDWSRRLGVLAQFGTLPPEPDTEPDEVYITLVDDADAGFSAQNYGFSDLRVQKAATAYRGGYHWNLANSEGDTCNWTFDDLPQGNFEIYVTYPGGLIDSVAAPFAIYDDTTLVGNTTVNQLTPPAGNVFDAFAWDSLGVYSIRSGRLVVRLTDNALPLRVSADAVRIEPRKPTITVHSIEKSLDDDGVTVTVEIEDSAP